jgi:very-short-patch-repair endonuclease
MPIAFEMSFASHKRARYWSEKNTVKPEDIPLYHQASKYWFKCDVCPHEFETLPYTIAKINTWCSYCSNKKICDDTRCSICYNKSFASSERAQYWSTKNTINPRNVFKSCNKKFIFNCNTCHNEFTATLNNISAGKWCKSCGQVKSHTAQMMKIDEFLERSKDAHGDTYDYSKVTMNGVDRPVTIVCKIHGDFEQTPYKHYFDKNGCPACGIINRADSNRYTLCEFVSKANKVHQNKYDYSKVVYVNSQTPVIITCNEHGDFSQAPNSHLQGCGCEKCGIKARSDKQRQTTEEFITKAKEVHGDTYDYSKTVYVSGHEYITIICKTHGDFTQDPYNHLSGTGCKRCTGIYCLEDFIKEAKKIHGDLYDYSLCVYDKSRKDVKIICKICGIFNQSPNSHLRGAGCSICLNKTEKKLYNWLKSLYPSTIKEYKVEWCRNPLTGNLFRYDFMIPDIKVIIELDGMQHFKQVRKWDNPEVAIKKDIFKMQKANEMGYKVIRLLQDDVYKNDDEWLSINLLSEINNPDRTDIFISSIENIYDEHIKLIESGVIIVLDKYDNSDLIPPHPRSRSSSRHAMNSNDCSIVHDDRS